MKRIWIRTLAFALALMALFLLPVAASKYDKGPSSPVAAQITGRGGQPAEAYFIKGNVYKDEAKSIFAMVNQERQARGLAELVWDEENYVAAQQRAFEISTHFAHERPDGRDVSTISSRYSGENLGSGTDGSNGARTVMKAWMESQGHKGNILKESYQAVAVACVEVDGRIYWVQIFSTEQPPDLVQLVQETA